MEAALKASSTLAAYVKDIYKGTALPYPFFQIPVICIDPEETRREWVKQNEIYIEIHTILIYCIMQIVSGRPEDSLMGIGLIKGLFDFIADTVNVIDGNKFASGGINYLVKSEIESISYETTPYEGDVWLRVGTIRFVGTTTPKEVD